mgnify:CR=1 FL=1
MGWSETKGIHIFTVLHENKIDNNVRGHIGTELQNKSETVISVRKQEHEKNLFDCFGCPHNGLCVCLLR